MAGFNDGGQGRWPLIFDGPATPDGRYCADKNKRGGRWMGKVAIVVRLDGSSAIEPLTDLYISRDGQSNILKSSGTWAVGGRVLMP